MIIPTSKNKRGKFKGYPCFAFKNENDKITAAADSFLYIKEYLEGFTERYGDCTIEEATRFFSKLPKLAKQIGMSELEWIETNGTLFWLVYYISTNYTTEFPTDENQKKINQKNHNLA